MASLRPAYSLDETRASAAFISAMAMAVSESMNGVVFTRLREAFLLIDKVFCAG